MGAFNFDKARDVVSRLYEHAHVKLTHQERAEATDLMDRMRDEHAGEPANDNEPEQRAEPPAQPVPFAVGEAHPERGDPASIDVTRGRPIDEEAPPVLPTIMLPEKDPEHGDAEHAPEPEVHEPTVGERLAECEQRAADKHEDEAHEDAAPE